MALSSAIVGFALSWTASSPPPSQQPRLPVIRSLERVEYFWPEVGGTG